MPDSPPDEAGARALTERIKEAKEPVCMLLLEAHARRAWLVLGYRSWEQYVHTELGLSRSRSYQLLDQGRVIAVIRSSAGISGDIDIHPYAAAQLKPHLAEIVETLRSRTLGLPESEARQIVAEVIRTHRHGRWRRDRSPAPDASAGLAPLFEAITCLAAMPAAAAAAEQVPEADEHRLADLRPALAWLMEFAREWDRRTR